MPIRKGEPWGAPGPLSADGVVVPVTWLVVPDGSSANDVALKGVVVSTPG